MSDSKNILETITKTTLDRRMALKVSSVALGSVVLAPHPASAAPAVKGDVVFNKPLTAVVIGAGNRGGVYTWYAQKNPKQLKIVAVAEPIKERQANMAKTHNIKKENRFKTWEDVFKGEKIADIAIITTPDDLHYGPAMEALKQGYDLLLEKPIAQTWDECNDILKLANKKKSMVAVCHVLRYAPYFVQIRNIIDSGEIGDVVSVQHIEPVHHIHYSHSYVRGNWGNVKKSTPMILAKSCHDLDILNWWLGKKCKRLTSFGSNSFFNKKNKPATATARCVDCPLQKKCGYSALRIYLWEKRWGTAHLLGGKPRTDANILSALKTGPYGRCVFQCDNDQVDHQTVSMEYDGGATVNFNMEALTSYGGRRTRIMGTKGDIVGDGNILTVSNFNTYKSYRWDVRKNSKDLGGHGGGDHRLVRDLLKTVKTRKQSYLSSTLEVSMASHLMGFTAEKSRAKGGKPYKIK